MATDDFHEIWWIYSRSTEEWGGLRIAHFRKTMNDATIVIISSEVDRRRIGMRVWEDIKDREGWVKVSQIVPPSKDAVTAAFAASSKT